MKIYLWNRLLLAGWLALAAVTVRADEEQDLLAILQSNAAAPQKCTACQRLRVVGTVQAVPALAALLGEEQVAHAARYALEGLPFPEALTALREAFGKTSGLIKVGLVDSLGWRRDTASVPLLAPLLSQPDTTLAAAAAAALGRIGGREAFTALSAVRDTVPAAVQPALRESLLQCAELVLSAGDAAGAASLYRALLDSKAEERFRVAAWRGLVLADAAQRAERVVQALAGADRPIQVVALQLVRQLNDPTVVAACVRQWAALPAESQLAVLDAQLKVGAGALPTVRTATQSPHLAVRLAAWQALGDLGDASCVAPLAKAAALGDASEREAARDSLARLRGAGVREALLENLERAEPSEKAEVLRALGERGDTEAGPVLLRYAATSSPAARAAALESLSKIAVPDTLLPLLELAAKAKSESESAPVLKALYVLCQTSRDKEQTGRQILEALGRYPATERRQVLPLLAELGTPAALETALAATRDPDQELVREAVRVLAQWPTVAPASRLLELARTSTDATLHTLALRSCFDVLGQEPAPIKRFALLQEALTAARGPDEEKLALGQLGQIPTPEALQAALARLTNPALANEAGLAAIAIAEKLAVADPKLAAEVAAQVLARCQAPAIVKRAYALRGKFAASGAFIRDWLVSGPYTQPGLAGAPAFFDVTFGPEKQGATVTWKPVPRADMINLSALFPDQANCVAYLKTQLIAPSDAQAVLLLGSDDGVKAWLNGTVVHANNVDRGAVVDQDTAPIQLKKGPNDLLLKITQGGGGWSACARVVGPDGKSIAGLQVKAAR